MYGIFTYVWLISMVNVGIYPYMDPQGMLPTTKQREPGFTPLKEPGAFATM